MNQKGFANIILVIVVVAVLGVAGYFTLVKKPNPISQPPTTTPSINSTTTTTTPTTTTKTTQPPTALSKYNTEPIAECVECKNGQTWNNKPCCTANFEKDCSSKNGVVRFSDLHPVFTALRGCFQKAPDAGKACSSATDCLSGVCDLESAIKNNKCSLIKKELTGEKNQYYGQEFYTATYSCAVVNPGICTETIKNRTNPGGVSHTFRMDGKTLIETLESGPIS